MTCEEIIETKVKGSILKPNFKPTTISVLYKLGNIETLKNKIRISRVQQNSESSNLMSTYKF